jgi:hypothetical protein
MGQILAQDSLTPMEPVGKGANVPKTDNQTGPLAGAPRVRRSYSAARVGPIIGVRTGLAIP